MAKENIYLCIWIKKHNIFVCINFNIQTQINNIHFKHIIYTKYIYTYTYIYTHTAASSAKISAAGNCLLFQDLTNLQHYLFLHFMYKLVFKVSQCDAVIRKCHRLRGSSDSPEVGYLIPSAWGDFGRELCRETDRQWREMGRNHLQKWKEGRVR